MSHGMKSAVIVECPTPTIYLSIRRKDANYKTKMIEAVFCGPKRGRHTSQLISHIHYLMDEFLYLIFLNHFEQILEIY